MTEQLRNKLATRAGATVRPAQESPQESVTAVVRNAVDRFGVAFAEVLPAGADPKRYARLVMVAIKANPKLLECFATPEGETSVLLAAMQCAALGLEPNTPKQLCWLIPRNTKIKGQNGERDRYYVECELQIGYRGYVRLVRGTAADKVKSIFAGVVRETDHFVWSRGLEGDTFEHVVDETRTVEDEGSLTHAYAVIRYLGGGYDFVVMNRTQVEKRRAMSQSWLADQKYGKSSSPWTNWPDEQWKKTALRALIKTADLSDEVDVAAYSDGAPLALTDGGTVTALPWNDDVPAELVEPPAALEQENGKPTSRADAREEAPAGVDSETGEVDPQPGDKPPPAKTTPLAPADKPMTNTNSRRIFALLNTHKMADRDDRLAYVSGVLGREVTSFDYVTRGEAVKIIDALEALPTPAITKTAVDDDPPTDGARQ